MQTQLKRLPQSEIELTVEILPNEMEVYLEAASRDLSRQNPIKGFRPGLAPRDVVERELGKQKIYHLAGEMAVRESFVKAILEHNLETIGQPRVTILKSEPRSPFIFKALIPVVPEIELGDYKKIKIPLAEIKVEPEEIDKVLEDLRKSRAVNTNVSRPAQKGDRVEIDFTARLDGVKIEGGESGQHPLILGEGHFMAGFEEALEGLKENETKTFSLNVPENYFQRQLAGKKLDFEVKMLLVQEHKLPQLDDYFAKSLGQFTGLDSLRSSLADGLQAEKKIKAVDERRAKIAEALVKEIKVELPEKLVEIELDKMVSELEQSLGRMNLGKEGYLSHIQKTEADLRKGWQSQAAQRVKIALALRQVAKNQNIVVGDEEIEMKLSELLRQAPPPKLNQNLDLAALRDYVRGLVRNEKVFEFLESNR